MLRTPKDKKYTQEEENLIVKTNQPMQQKQKRDNDWRYNSGTVCQ
jgi:hypothetical protein